MVTSWVKRPCKRLTTRKQFNTHRPTAKAHSIAYKMLTQMIKSSKFLCLKPLPLPEGPTHIPPMHISKPSYSHSFIVALITLVLHRRELRSGVNIRLETADYTPGRVYIFSFLHLKVVGNEKRGGSGSKLLIEYGFGPWRSMSV